MEKRQLGTSEIQITPIIMGTWQAGKRMWVGIEDAETVKAMRAAFEAGITTFDTAEVYGEGHSEQIIGEALSDVRSQVVYASKVFANHLKSDLVIEACDRSLKNLNTDYIDLYQIHWPAGTWNSELVPIAETMDALNKLKEQGKIRARSRVVRQDGDSEELILEAMDTCPVNCIHWVDYTELKNLEEERKDQVIPVVGFPAEYATIRTHTRQRQKRRLGDRKFKGGH